MQVRTALLVCAFLATVTVTEGIDSWLWWFFSILSAANPPTPAPTPATSAPTGAPTGCNPATTNLLDFEAWRREEGFWIGEYTFLGGDGDPYTSSSWNYPYDHYKGFIHIEIVGNHLKQRNVFLYPPQTAAGCAESDPVDQVNTNGGAVCGVNGAEKVFSADQDATDCNGNLAGPFGPFWTKTTVIGNSTVLYEVVQSATDTDKKFQNQLTTLQPQQPGERQKRVRTAQGFSGTTPSYASFYREERVSKDEFINALCQARTGYRILSTDECCDPGFGDPTCGNNNCDAHFGFNIVCTP